MIVWLWLVLAGSSPRPAEVAIQTFQFSPDSIVVESGTVVRWRNEDDVLHTVTAGSPDSVATWFDGALDGPGAQFTVTFEEPGIYSYHCARHAFMRGRVHVIPSREE